MKNYFSADPNDRNKQAVEEAADAHIDVKPAHDWDSSDGSEFLDDVLTPDEQSENDIENNR